MDRHPFVEDEAGRCRVCGSTAEVTEMLAAEGKAGVHLARGGYIARGTGTHPLPLNTGYLIPASSVSRLTKGGRPKNPEDA